MCIYYDILTVVRETLEFYTFTLRILTYPCANKYQRVQHGVFLQLYTVERAVSAYATMIGI